MSYVIQTDSTEHAYKNHTTYLYLTTKSLKLTSESGKLKLPKIHLKIT